MVHWSQNKISPAGVIFFALLIILPVNVPAFTLRKREANLRSPVILVPGDGGSQIEAKLNKTETVHYFCNKKSDDFFSLWLNLELLVPLILDCWVDNMRLVYDNVTRKTLNSPGVEIRIPGFGNTSSVEWLDPSQISPKINNFLLQEKNLRVELVARTPIVNYNTWCSRKFFTSETAMVLLKFYGVLSAYFKSIVERLVSLGYKRGVDVKGAPYDYRRAPNEMAQYYADIKKMTEETYEQNSQVKITFICHSMGCPIMSYFFNQQSQAWKDKYVHALISLGGAWGGAVKALKAFSSGENLGVYVIKQLTVRAEQRTSSSLSYVLPSDKLWAKDEVLVMTPSKNYSISNFYDYFQDIGFPVGYEMYKDTYSYASTGLNPPGVEIHCLYGMNVTDTIERISFKEGHFPDSPDLIFGNGDGTVNARSLEACILWQNKQSQKIYPQPMYNVDHMEILKDENVLNYIQKVVLL